LLSILHFPHLFNIRSVFKFISTGKSTDLWNWKHKGLLQTNKLFDLQLQFVIEEIRKWGLQKEKFKLFEILQNFPLICLLFISVQVTFLASTPQSAGVNPKRARLLKSFCPLWVAVAVAKRSINIISLYFITSEFKANMWRKYFCENIKEKGDESRYICCTLPCGFVPFRVTDSSGQASGFEHYWKGNIIQLHSLTLMRCRFHKILCQPKQNSALDLGFEVNTPYPKLLCPRGQKIGSTLGEPLYFYHQSWPHCDFALILDEN